MGTFTTTKFSPTPRLIGKLEMTDCNDTEFTLESSCVLDDNGSLVKTKERFAEFEPVMLRLSYPNRSTIALGLSVIQLQVLADTLNDMISYLGE